MKISFFKNIGIKDTDSKNFWIPIILFVFSFLIRIIILIGFSKSPSFNVPIIDEANYNELARALASGEKMDRSFFWQPFFYPFFLSIVYFFTDSSILVAKVVQILVGSLTSLLIYFLAKEVFDRKAGIIAGITASLYAPMILFETLLLSEGWAVFFSALLLFLILKVRKSKNLLLIFLLGIISGLSIIARPTFLLFIIVALCWLIFDFFLGKMPVKLIIYNGLVLLTGLFIILFPVSLKNFTLTDNFTFLPHSGPINLFIGNNPDADKTIQLRPGTDWDNMVSMAKINGAETLQEEQRYYLKFFFNYMLSDPIGFIIGIFNKTLQFFSSREIPRTTDLYIFRKYSFVFSILVWNIGNFGFPFGLLLPLALIGIFYNHKKIPVYFYFLLLTYSLSIIAVFVSSRLRLPIIPAIIVIASAGTVTFYENIKNQIQNKKWQKIIIATVLIITLAMSVSIPGPFATEKHNYESEMLTIVATSCLGKGNVKDSIKYLNEALKINPKNKIAYRVFGLIYLIHDDFREAEEFFKKAISLDNEYAEAYYDYGNLYYMLGNYDEALIKFKKTIELSPYFFEAEINIGSIFFLKRNFNEAIFHFEKALKIKPENVIAHKKAGDAFMEIGNFEKAIFYFYKAFIISPDADTAYILANLYFKNNPQTYDIDESIKWAKIACRLSSNTNAEYLFMLAVINLRMNRKDQAIDNAEKALSFADSSDENELAAEIKEFIKNNKLYKYYFNIIYK
ncbi:MAG: tetratricopeptide repeat protein [Spirochaetes bacterium]|nr:tetratricopeptide repeat protein [Spirochaetota bacterium]